MEFHENKTITLERKVRKGTLRIRIEQDGTVDVNGYLYKTDGKTKEEQMKFLNELSDIFVRIMDQLNAKGIPESKDKKWYKFWRKK